MRKTILLGLLLCSSVAAQAQTGKNAGNKPAPAKATAPATPAAVTATPESAAPKAQDNQLKAATDNEGKKSRMSNEEYREISAGHELLISEAGKWRETMTLYGKPNERLAAYDMVSTREMILGNRFQKIERNGSINGLEFAALGYIGYNNASQKYTAVWMDDKGTGTLVLEGVFHEEKNTITFNGEYMDHNTMSIVKITDEYVITDETSRVYRRYSTYQGRQSFMTMEIQMTRLQ